MLKPTITLTGWAITDRDKYFVLTGWAIEEGREYFHTSKGLLQLDFVLKTAETEDALYVLGDKY